MISSHTNSKCYFLSFNTDTPSIVFDSSDLVENDTAVFHCESKFNGRHTEEISPSHIPDMKMFFMDDQYQELPAVDVSKTKGNTLIKVCH